MIQIYFLSIVCNALAGYILISGNSKGEEQPCPFLKDDTFRLVLGVISIVIGLLKIFTPQGNIVILGDLIPAAAGFASGIVLLVQYYRNKTTLPEDEGAETKLGLIRFLTIKRIIVGYIAIAAAVLHFLFPRIIFF